MKFHIIISIILFALGASLKTEASCDFTTSQNVTINPAGNHNLSAAFTQIYLLVDEDGVIVSTSANGDFGIQNFGNYSAYAYNYETSLPPSTLPAIGIDISDINDGCGIFSNALFITVCNTSNLVVCENSGNDIVIAMNADFNSNSSYEELIIIVDDATGNILYISTLNSSTGSINYTTTSITGDLTNGSYSSYSVNYENSETLSGLGLIVGNPWTGNFTGACALHSAGVNISVDICCGADAGITVATSSDPTNNDFVLCWNESISLINATFSLPGVDLNEGFGYAVYSAPMPGTVPDVSDIDFIEFLVGTGLNASVTLINDGSYTPPFINNPSQTIYLYPVTLDNTTIPAIDDNGDNCLDVGQLITITFLNDINATNLQDCLTESGVYNISGGYPEFFTGNYNITNQGTGVLSSSILSTSGGNISVTNLQIGDIYAIDIVDDNNCFLSTQNETYDNNLSFDSIIITGSSCNNICDGAITIYSENASQYSFDAITFGNDTVATSLCGGDITLTIEGNGCVIDSIVNITQPTPVILSNSNDTIICVGSTIALNGNAQGGNPAYNYYWNDALGSSTLNVTPINDSLISIYALDGNNCSSDTNQINVTLLDSLALQANILDSICQGENFILTSSGIGGNSNYLYSWSNDDGTGFNEQGNNVTVSPTASTIYTVELSDNCGSPFANIAIEVLVNDLPDIMINTNYIEGCYPLTAEFINSSTNVISNGTCNWSFSNGETSNLCNPNITFETPGCFDATLTLESVSGCINSATFQSIVCVGGYPESGFIINPNNLTVENSSAEFTNESLDNSTNEWFINGNLFSNELNPSYQFEEVAGSYEICLTVTNQYQCEDSYCDSVKITDIFSLYVPNTFTPNGNGDNDYFGAITSEGLLDKYEMWVFNRWGETIFYTNQVDKFWDGTHKGTNSKQDTYVWLIKYKLSNVPRTNNKTGHVNLLR